MAKKYTLTDWIEDVGVNQIASALVCERSTIRFWKRGDGLPTLRQMYKIVRISKGKLTYESIIEDFIEEKFPEVLKVKSTI